VREGEIAGVAGVAGNGQRELAEAITGLRPVSSGSVSVYSRRLRSGDPRTAIAAGIAHVPDDRLGTGVASGLSIAENSVLKSYRSISHGPLLNWNMIRSVARDLIRRYGVATPGPQLRARDLSGGNLQKLVLGREFSANPRVLIAASPTRGLDVGAIEYMSKRLRAAAASGIAVLLVSTELEEILDLSDRIAVLARGRVIGELDRHEATSERLGLLLGGIAHDATEGGPYAPS